MRELAELKLDWQLDDLESLSLDALGTIAVSEREMAEGLADGALGHFIRCGQVLLVIRRRVTGGNWSGWCRANGWDVPWASRIMRLAYYHKELPPDAVGVHRTYGGHLRNPSVVRALKTIEHLPPITLREDIPKQHPREMRKTAKELRDLGASWSEISRQLGVAQMTVRDWCETPEQAKERKRRRAESLKAKSTAKKIADAAAKRAQRDELARMAGGDMSVAYSLVRKLCLALDAAAGGMDGDTLRACRAAAHYATSAETAIVRAMNEQRASS